VRTFAEAAAASGVPALRFDYLGTGDSEDIQPQADQVNAWSMDVVAAVTELQGRTGVHRICLMGIRLGALLASLASRKCNAVTSIILIAPVLSGRRYLRELRMIQLAAPRALPRGHTPSMGNATLEVSGFPMSAATIAALAAIELTPPRSPPVSAMLIIDGSSAPSTREWAQSLRSSPVRTTYMALPGLIEMINTEPQCAAVPWDMVAAMRDWLPQQGDTSQYDDTGTQGDTRQRSSMSIVADRSSCGGACAFRSESPSMAISPPYDEALSGTQLIGAQVTEALLTERPVFIDSGALLFGIVTEPGEGAAYRGGVILQNSGAVHHIGSNRMYVSLARRWARRGYVVLRVDLGGIGDSSTRPASPDDDVFAPAAIDDIRAAIQFVRDRYQVSDITLGGVCSGAYHALHAAAANVSVNRILMVNPINFFWKKGVTVRELQLADVVRNPRVYRDRLFSQQAWRKLLTGKVKLWRIAHVYVQHSLLGLEGRFRDLSRRLNIRLPYDLGRNLSEIAARGIQVVFVFASGEPGIALLKFKAGLSLERLGNRCRVHIVEGGDHTFSQSAARKTLERILSDELTAQSEPARP
jgi:pimeloyl-ACP methyl ester carboxylesterase